MERVNLIGKTVLGYQIEEKINAGTFGTVYKAVKRNMAGEYVRALKHITIPTDRQYFSVLNSMGGDTSKADNYFAEMLENIVSEIRILNDLSEAGVRHIVRYYENDIAVTESPRRYDVYILMELLTPFEVYFQEADEFLVRDVMDLAKDVLKGIQACHENGIIHRDIKDDNIFVSEKGEYKIGDFGVSKILKGSAKAESVKGTPDFLAPEVYLGKTGYTKSVDLYSLGIVLYRLLNYGRNPFLPRFPEQYFSQDEDEAFEKRMSGQTPECPALGGTKIGQVIVKAISGSDDRFQEAEEFYQALLGAIERTSLEELETTVKMSMPSCSNTDTCDGTEKYKPTMWEQLDTSKEEERPVPKEEPPAYRRLFVSATEIPPYESYEPEASRFQDPPAEGKGKAESNHSARSTKSVNGHEKRKKEERLPHTGNKKRTDGLVFLIPILFLATAVVVYFLILPNIYGTTISFAGWLTSDPQDIIDHIHKTDVKVSAILVVRAFWYIWFVGGIISLYFAGRRIFMSRKPAKVEPVLIKREPYDMIQRISHMLRQIEKQRNTGELDVLIYAIEQLEKRLSVESEFGEGNESVLECENNIAYQMRSLLDAVLDAERGGMTDNATELHRIVSHIGLLLNKRKELERN